MNTFYTVVTVWPNDHTDTTDFPNLEAAMKDWEFRSSMRKAFPDRIESVRILRISDKRILDITPGRELTE